MFCFISLIAALAFGAPPATLEVRDFERQLQHFVDAAYRKAFRHLGDERDFDHAHVLRSRSGKPFAILYHTQELAAHYRAGEPFAYIDPFARNWIEWLDSSRIENARKYLKSGASLNRRFTVYDDMLDPALMGQESILSDQWVFTRRNCESRSTDRPQLRIVLPNRRSVCLSLKR